ncbi:hypothetical protein CFI11_02385 [Thalassococcus sp. S3]|nr:hypothetical protein CFI11_02385 [Thalassococcus sp. S3]
MAGQLIAVGVTIEHRKSRLNLRPRGLDVALYLRAQRLFGLYLLFLLCDLLCQMTSLFEVL